MTATAGSSRTAFPAPSYPMERTCPYSMPAGYGPLREHRPLSRVSLYDGRSVWLVSGSDVGRALLRDPRIFLERDVLVRRHRPGLGAVSPGS